MECGASGARPVRGSRRVVWVALTVHLAVEVSRRSSPGTAAGEGDPRAPDRGYSKPRKAFQIAGGMPMGRSGPTIPFRHRHDGPSTRTGSHVTPLSRCPIENCGLPVFRDMSGIARPDKRVFTSSGDGPPGCPPPLRARWRSERKIKSDATRVCERACVGASATHFLMRVTLPSQPES